MTTTYEQHVEKLSRVLTSDIGNLIESESYMDGDFRLQTIGLGAPPELEYIQTNPGWSSTYVRSIEERLDVEGFRVSGASDSIDDLWQWWQDNNLDEESGLGHTDALTFGRSYITIAAPDVKAGDDPNSPIIRLESPLHMFAEIDPRTRRVTRAVRLYRTDNGEPGSAPSNVADKATLYLPNETVYLSRANGEASPWSVDPDGITKHRLGIVPVVPLTNKGKLSNRYGRSEISTELRQLTDAGARTLMNLQAASELMAVPLRVLMGVRKEDLVNEAGDQASIDELYYGRLLALSSDAAKAFEFKAAELRNFTDEMSELAKQVASATGLPPQYLSFSSENPASAEAILASESRLVKLCERKARMFGGSWEQAMRLALRVMKREVPQEYTRLETVWRDPSTPTYAAKADAATKLYGNGQGPVPKEQTRIDLGYTAAQRDQMKEWDKDDQKAIAALAAIVGPPKTPDSSSTNPPKPHGTQTAHA